MDIGNETLEGGVVQASVSSPEVEMPQCEWTFTLMTVLCKQIEIKKEGVLLP